MSDIDELLITTVIATYRRPAMLRQAINSALLALEKDPGRTGHLDEVFRHVHTLKSSSAMLEFTDVAELAHSCEDLLERLRKLELAVTPETIWTAIAIIVNMTVIIQAHPFPFNNP